MTKKNRKPKETKTGEASTLRERAEKLLHASPSEIPPQDVAVLLHELQVHRMELEIQNEELRRAQQKLEESRNRYYDLYDFAPVGYITTSATGIILECNLAGADMFGMVRKRLLGKLFQGFVFPDDLYIFLGHRKRLLEEKPKDACEFRLTKKGRSFFCRLESACVRDRKGNPVGIRSALIDVTGKKRYEEELQKANERFAALAENAQDIISRRDRDLRCTYINPAVEAHLGVPREAFPGKTIEEAVKTGEFPRRIQEVFAEVFRSGEGKSIEFEHETAEGLKSFHSIVIPEKNSEGVVDSILTVTRDITPLKTLQKDLEKKVSERTADLAQVNLKLEEQIERRIKYENALKSAAEKIITEVERRRLLSRRLVRLIEEDRRNVAMTLHDHLGQLLTTLAMDLEMIESGTKRIEITALAKKARQKAIEALNATRNISHELRPSALESLGLVPSLASLFETIKGSSRMEIAFFHTGVPENLEREKALALFRIVQESITNALKHASPRHIFVNLISRKGLIHLTVEDDGKGFDQEADALGPRGPLGIEIMKERAVDVGGTLRIESRPGKGTQVIAEVPI